ncbi:hypothetical protein FRACYDRAFT_252250 [Fragilariopsis cylindrus CCMP1102]|uniref:Uncharacterized protein n=1 Tax=Fragilariopsis cylindrus CCMP1102 TaxID=635003 RepID=A0A1E7EML6_9STRA|nr:hypothetical protein FRACYDRAFT_252250 [Fragilariopsis cylindrus CCMP1102]|eukprot:OEU07077.1 hypothetical protein FRACYDRAFT_252250 [Fragilariopsis cylindrus CCMP1102]
MTVTTTIKSRRRRIQRHSSNNKPRPFVRSFSVISFLTIFLIISFVTFVRIENNIVFATDVDADADVDADVDACEKATISLMESNESLMESKKTYSDSMESSMTNEETSSTSSGGSDWSFGFLDNDVETYRTACLNNNNDNTIWTEIQSSTGEGEGGEEYFICDLPQMKVSGKSVELYGIGECFANTTECRAITPMTLAERLWKKVGLDCHTTNNGNGNSKWDELGLSESDEKCMDDTKTMNDEYPDVEKAIKEFGKTMNVDMDDVKDMKLGFEDEDVNKLKSVCSYVDGYFTLVKEDEFDCDMMSLKADLKVLNIANCIADTEECKNMNPLLLLEKVFKSMGVKCTEKKAQGEGDKNHESQDDKQDDNSNTTKSDQEDGPDDDDYDDKDFVEALGLTESEVTCMNNSSGFIDSSDMRWDLSSIKSEDVTCVIDGRERCLNVYNFGNCLSTNDDCRKMDPMVLVEGFFLEVLKFTCRAKCDKHKDSGHSPSSSQHNTPGVSSSSKDSTSGDDDGSTSYIAATVVLCVVIALGFFGYYRIRRSSGRERVPRRAYEMTDISDLQSELVMVLYKEAKWKSLKAMLLILVLIIPIELDLRYSTDINGTNPQ